MVKQNLIMFLFITNFVLTFMLLVDYTFANLVIVMILIIADLIVFRSY